MAGEARRRGQTRPPCSSWPPLSQDGAAACAGRVLQGRDRGPGPARYILAWPSQTPMLRRPALISGDPAAPEGSRRPGTRPGTRARSQFPPGQPRSGKVRCRVCLFMFFKGDKYIRASRSEKAPCTEESVLALPSGGPISPPRRPRPHDKRVPVKPERFKYNSTTGFHPQEGKPSHKAESACPGDR